MNRMAAPGPLALQKEALLPALADPDLGAISFLNEVMDRFPDAISFAPGAPFAGFFDDIDLDRYLATYRRHLMATDGLTEAQVLRRLYQYGPARGLINGLLATALRIDDGIDVDPRAIVVTVGCQEAMVLALRTLCPGPGDLLAVVTPCFVGLAGAAKILGIAMVPVGEGDGGVDCAALAQACAAARAAGRRIRALYVAPDYANPSGSLMDLDTRHALLALAEAHDFLVIEDNAYAFTAAPAAMLPALKALDTRARVVYLGTCAKICMPGVRVGFVVADQPVRDAAGQGSILADALTLVKSMLTVNTSPICQAIVGGMLLEHGGSLAALAQDKAHLYRRNLRCLLDALARHLPPPLCAQHGLSWTHPQGGFFVCLRLSVAADHALLDASARRHGVLWTPMSAFYIDGGGRNELRLACSYLTPDQIEEGVRRLACFLTDPALVPAAGQFT